MEHEDWLKSAIRKSGGKFVEIICPLLADGLCSIYEYRPDCCKNFPRKGGYYCSKSDCRITEDKIRKNTKKSSDICFGCKNICCTKILVPKGAKATKSFIRKWMSIDCAVCKKIFT